MRMEVVEDRLSSLPDELIHQILSRFDMKFAVQTSVLSSRWKLVWTSMTCLNFSHEVFCGDQCKFAKFVAHVLSHRNHQVQVSLVKLVFLGAANAELVSKFANYAFSHNVQQVSFENRPLGHHAFPHSLFSSHSLKHFTFITFGKRPCVTPKTPWDFPALTSLYIRGITLCGDLFSKCVNLKNLTLKCCRVEDVEAVFDIIAPRLSNLTLIHVVCLKVINVAAPRLENLTMNNCQINYLNAPPGLASFCYGGCRHPPLFKDRFYSINNVTIRLSGYYRNMLYQEEYARNTVNMLLQLRGARFLTLNADILECISSFPDLLSHHASPFSNLICLTIDSSMKEFSYEVKMSAEARNFLLHNSPTATALVMDRLLRTRCLTS